MLRPSNDWLKFVLLPKLCKWTAAETSGGNECSGATPTSGTPLVPIDEYHALYRQLKDKYAAYFIEVS